MKNKKTTTQNINFSLIEEKIGLKFKNQALLKNAFIHKSYTYEMMSSIKQGQSNEKLELLGDSVLSLIVLEFLYKKYPNLKEGQISKLKAFIVSKESLSRISKNLNLGNYLLLGKGERLNEANKKNRLLCDVLEALIGAYYLDSGYQKVIEWIIPHIIKQIETIKNQNIKDYKTALQIIVQKKYQICPEYIIKTEEGLDHEKIFHTIVKIKNQIFGYGKGRSKKIAEQNSALEALNKIEKNLNLF